MEADLLAIPENVAVPPHKNVVALVVEGHHGSALKLGPLREQRHEHATELEVGEVGVGDGGLSRIGHT